MRYELRDYQKESVEKGIKFLLDKKKKTNAVIVAPTGSGKSLIIANIANGLDGKVIVFQPSKELLEQNYEKFISYGSYAEIYSASAGRKKISDITFATIGSVVNKPELFEEFKYCIVDECHLVSPDDSAMYKKFFSQLKLKVLGLTATPVRMKRYNFPYPHAKICMLDRMRPRFFSEYLHITQISEMKQNGYFSELDYYDYKFDESKLQLNTTGADFTTNSISFALKESRTINQVIELYNSIVNKSVIKHILIFIDSIDNAEYLAKSINSKVITGNTNKKERESILSDFKSGKIKSVVNVGVLTTGFDFPELDCIIMARPTMSLALYYQIIGRAVRPHENKKKAYVFDFVGNFKRFGKVEDLVIEEINGNWCINNGTRILTNTSISEEKLIDEPIIITFGKYSGTEIKNVPIEYLKWYTENATKSKYNKFIFDYYKQEISKEDGKTDKE